MAFRMRGIGARGRRAIVLLALLAVSLGLYAAAESSVAGAEVVLPTRLVALRLITVKIA